RLAGKICPDGIITDATEMQRIYLEEFNTRSVCIAYGANIETSVDPEAVRRYGLEPFRYYLIASRLVPENNADLIVKGFERLRSQRLLAIAGDANYRSTFVDALKQTRDPRVRFLGHVSNSDDVKELHCNCYGYIHGHSVGGTNPALLKAFGYGNLVLALDNPFNRDVVDKYGILFARNPDDLASKLQFVEDQPQIAERYRRQAEQRILQNYTWDHITDQYEDYFGRLASGEKPALDRKLGLYIPAVDINAGAIGVLTRAS
ncbi:MAG: glycosyltransferase, partial [Terriglobales bacterium]